MLGTLNPPNCTRLCGMVYCPTNIWMLSSKHPRGIPFKELDYRGTTKDFGMRQKGKCLNWWKGVLCDVVRPTTKASDFHQGVVPVTYPACSEHISHCLVIWKQICYFGGWGNVEVISRMLTGPQDTPHADCGSTHDRHDLEPTQESTRWTNEKTWLMTWGAHNQKERLLLSAIWMTYVKWNKSSIDRLILHDS